MLDLVQIQSILKALPDPVFVLTRSGRYAAIFKRADAALYQAKRLGRNRIASA